MLAGQCPGRIRRSSEGDGGSSLLVEQVRFEGGG